MTLLVKRKIIYFQNKLSIINYKLNIRIVRVSHIRHNFFEAVEFCVARINIFLINLNFSIVIQ